MTTIDLSQLPTPTVVEQLDYESILAARKARLVSLYPADQQADIAATLELESEPIVKVLQESAYREMVLRQRCNEASLAVMVPYAQGTDLDNLAAGFGVKRLQVSPADPDAVPPVEAIYEDSDDLRQRIPDAFEETSVAGPAGAYRSLSKAADGRIADVSVESPAPCEIDIWLLGRTGDGSVGDDVIANVMAALSDEDTRPLGDLVTAHSAQIVTYAVDATIYLFKGPQSELVLKAANDRLAAYIAAQRKIKRAIRRSGIDAALMAEGVEHVEIRSPAADIIMAPGQAGYCTSITVVPDVNDE